MGCTVLSEQAQYAVRLAGPPIYYFVEKHLPQAFLGIARQIGALKLLEESKSEGDQGRNLHIWTAD